MSKDNSTISFDFLGSFWNITSYPTSHALSDGIISGTLRRYQAVSTKAVPVASLPKLDVPPSGEADNRSGSSPTKRIL